MKTELFFIVLTAFFLSLNISNENLKTSPYVQVETQKSNIAIAAPPPPRESTPKKKRKKR